MSQNRDSGGSNEGQGTGSNRNLPQPSGGGQATGAAPGLAKAAEDYGQKIAAAATQAKEYMSDTVSVVGDKIKDLQNKDFGEMANEAKEYARKNPGQAILISAAAGLILGLLIRSGSRR
jgi:ElaB/YqjD/DUF883 family membrane-anchored ribosome-binding protein